MCHLHCAGQDESELYFNRAHLQPFCSSLQAEIDTLSADADQVPGGLIVLRSVQTEMTALLEDCSAPLFNRITDEIDVVLFASPHARSGTCRLFVPAFHEDPSYLVRQLDNLLHLHRRTCYRNGKFRSH